MRYATTKYYLCGLAAALLLVLAAAPGQAAAQGKPAATPTVPSAAAGSPEIGGASPVAVPGFWDPKRRPEKPDVARMPVQIRFVTTEDYPPFSFRGEDGRPVGFNIDMARAICAELAVTCSLEVVPFEGLSEALAGGKADAAIAGLAITPASRQQMDFSDRYFRSPARFVARKADIMPAVTPDLVAAKTVGVVAGTAHEAYLRDFFAEVAIRSFPTAEAARAALQKGEVDLVFGDGVQLAFWLNGSSSENCCGFAGGPFTESLYFGEGMGIAVRRGDDALRQSLNYALAQIWETGAYVDLYLRWFPIGIY
ncbi:transporter substrate-binding domain-containing protein [Ancylobacter sonchi]|uniref:transporter substrate-binding domain-containing protein n=1 Tax=Ancylobacter sonchi TaxID=1937790 RepID=UPI0028AD5FFE|nr:transporter substrate-binding domain-containing protein [Ancylobacter sonchi]